MSSAYVLIAFAVCILLMILFISKWKIHPVTSILVATIILAISIGTPWDKIEGIINKGMSDTLKSIAIVIVLGCILGKVLEETGAAVSITKATVKLFGEKRVLWAILLASGILGIPIWADTVVILLNPHRVQPCPPDQQVHDVLRHGRYTWARSSPPRWCRRPPAPWPPPRCSTCRSAMRSCGASSFRSPPSSPPGCTAHPQGARGPAGRIHQVRRSLEG